MKKYIIILFSMLLLIGGLTNAQTIKRSKQNTEQTQKSNNPTKSRTNTTKSSKAENPKSNNSSSTKKHQSQKANITPSDRSSSSSSSGSSSSRSTSRGGIPVKPTTNDVTFTCNVQNAQLFVDGQNLGNANGKYKLTASNHLIREKSDGYQERIIYFDASSTSTLKIELTPE